MTYREPQKNVKLYWHNYKNRTLNGWVFFILEKLIYVPLRFSIDLYDEKRYSYVMNMGIIIEWIFGNILWELLIVFVVAFLSLFKIIWISRKLLSQNRDTRGNAWGIHLADRFVDMWYSSDKNPLQNFGKSMYTFPNTTNSRYWIEVVDKNLHSWKLIERDSSTYDRVFKPVRNLRNRIILLIVEIWLVCIVGDNRQFYKNLKQRLRK